jgi:hypothetical protein
VPSNPTISVPASISAHPAWARLEHQLTWYDSKSQSCQRWFKRLKVCQIALAVSIPLLAQLPRQVLIAGVVDVNPWATSIAGAAIAILEGVQAINQYSFLWVTYRATAERLKHEKHLFLASAGPFRGLPEEERLILLAERVEEHVSTEHANWFDESKRATRGGPRGS